MVVHLLKKLAGQMRGISKDKTQKLKGLPNPGATPGGGLPNPVGSRSNPIVPSGKKSHKWVPKIPTTWRKP